jgi:NAD dependent epimerase/dehydratase
MKILITGADGFIGSRLTELLVGRGFEVTALSYYNSFGYYGWLEKIFLENKKNLKIIQGDIRDLSFCYDITRNVDIVLHLAALIAIPYSYVSPLSYLDTNINGTTNICLASLKNKVKKIVHTSTSEVYGTAKYVPIDEHHPLQPQSPYSASKIGADNMAYSFYNSFDLPLAILRPFNTYGPRQSLRAVIPTIITQIASGQKNIKIGDLTTTRDFNYVDDICEDFINVMHSKKTLGKIINSGSGKEISIYDLCNLIKKLMKKDVNFISKKERLRPKKSEVMRLCADNKLRDKLISANKRQSLSEGLKKTIKWFNNPENLKNFKSNIYNI